MYPPREGDLPRDELIARAKTLIEQTPGQVRIYVKWTCPKCGERVTSPEWNTFHTDGYIHDEPYCGYHYTGDRFGFMMEVING